MRISPTTTRLGAIAAATLFAYSSGSADIAYLDEIESWKMGRVERLKGPSGFLNLVGLFWLRADVSTIGSSPDRDFILPDHAAPMVGSLRKEAGTVLMAVEDGVVVYHKDAPVESIVMEDDQSERPVMLTHGSLAWTVIRDLWMFIAITRQEHPQVLNGWPAAAVVKVDDMQLFTGDENIARMKVRM